MDNKEENKLIQEISNLIKNDESEKNLGEEKIENQGEKKQKEKILTSSEAQEIKNTISEKKIAKDDFEREIKLEELELNKTKEKSKDDSEVIEMNKNNSIKLDLNEDEKALKIEDSSAPKYENIKEGIKIEQKQENIKARTTDDLYNERKTLDLEDSSIIKNQSEQTLDDTNTKETLRKEVKESKEAQKEAEAKHKSEVKFEKDNLQKSDYNSQEVKADVEETAEIINEKTSNIAEDINQNFNHILEIVKDEIFAKEDVYENPEETKNLSPSFWDSKTKPQESYPAPNFVAINNTDKSNNDEKQKQLIVGRVIFISVDKEGNVKNIKRCEVGPKGILTESKKITPEEEKFEKESLDKYLEEKKIYNPDRINITNATVDEIKQYQDYVNEKELNKDIIEAYNKKEQNKKKFTSKDTSNLTPSNLKENKLTAEKEKNKAKDDFNFKPKEYTKLLNPADLKTLKDLKIGIQQSQNSKKKMNEVIANVTKASDQGFGLNF